MPRVLGLLALTVLVSVTVVRAAEPSDDELKKKPITADRGEVGKLLKKWWEEGTAAGNVGDWYDNRDGDHSPLDLHPWPQLRKVAYTPEDVKGYRHWALMTRVRDAVTFGNSSTSAPPEMGGSNPRTAYVFQQALAILEKQYLGNNLYIYPEHRDHDPGHNGVGDGYGDLYPTNTPYLIISQGSSGSDQPFMRAVPFTLAALRPEVKKKLTETGLLMPAVQMIFRSSNKHLKAEKEYLTGKAHPSVFEGANVDALKMVKLAHAITADTIPPLVRLKVTKEDVAENGRDFFEPAGLSEQHADTSAAVARIWRGSGRSRTLLVSAADSIDVNKKPLTFTWVLLRGDEKRVKITPKDRSGRVAEVRIEYHERRPIAPGSPMESNRVDVGVFAHNGSHYSAPAFLTFYSHDSEARTYDENGRPVEIGYGMGQTEFKVPDFGKLFAELSKEGPAAAVLGVTAEQRKELARLAKRVGEAQEQVAAARKSRQEAEAARNKASGELRQAEQKLAALNKENGGEEQIAAATAAVDAAKKRVAIQEESLKTESARLAQREKALNDELDGRRDALGTGARPFVLAALQKAARSAALWNDHAATLRKQADADKGRAARVEAARKKLLDLGIAAQTDGGVLAFRPARGGEGPDRLTDYERAMTEQFNAAVLNELLLPGLLQPVFRTNFVDRRLTAPKEWRDVYHQGGGWTRYAPGAKPADFTAEGWQVTKKDDKGRPVQARTVVYRQAPAPKGSRWVNASPLKYAAGDEAITFEYDGEKRKVKGREKVQEGR